MKKYILFAGVNGAGKSTLYQSQTFPFDFLSTFLSTFDFQSLESPCLQAFQNSTAVRISSIARKPQRLTFLGFCYS